jgi:hypothetical protein
MLCVTHERVTLLYYFDLCLCANCCVRSHSERVSCRLFHGLLALRRLLRNAGLGTGRKTRPDQRPTGDDSGHRADGRNVSDMIV